MCALQWNGHKKNRALYATVLPVETKLTYPGTAEVTPVLFLLSPQVHTFPFFPLFSALRTFIPILSSIHFSCSLVHPKVIFFAIIWRSAAQLRHYPESPKFTQTTSAPEIREMQTFEHSFEAGLVQL